MKKNVKASYASVFRIFRMVTGFNRMLAVSTFVRTVYKLAGICFTVLLAGLVEKAAAGSTPGFLSCCGIFVLLAAVPFLSYTDTYVSHDVSFRIVKELQNKVYDHMDRIAPGALTGINTADAATLILSDISVFEWFVAHCLVEWMGTFITIIACLVLMMSVSVPAATVVFVMLVMMLLIPLLFSGRANEKGLTMKKLYGELNSIIADGVAGHKDIIGFHRTGTFFSRLSFAAQRFSEAKSKYAARGEAEKTVEAILSCLAIMAGILLSAGCAGEGILQGLLPVFALCSATVICIQDSLGESTNFGFVFGAATRMTAILDRKPTVTDSGRIRLEPAGAGAARLTLEDVSFSYDHKEMLLQDISFEAAPGELVCIVSASGGGKSTISRLLQRFWDAESGHIRINDTDIRDITLESLRDMIMVVPQETYLFHDSIYANLLLARPGATEEDVLTALSDAMASGFVNQLTDGVNTVLSENGSSLSGGERQRLALAQAFLKNPPVLVLDESTSALDRENEYRIMNAVKRRRTEKTTIMITHRISSMKMADRIVFIRNGRVKDEGTYSELVERCEEFEDLVRGEFSENDQE